MRNWLLIPTKEQWNKWSLPSKLTFAGTFVGVLSLLLTVLFFVLPLIFASDPTEKRLDGALLAAIEDAIHQEPALVTQTNGGIEIEG
ncbi:hypothetical protein AB3X96_26420 [Paraburkholderia sp. BR13439]|uniref:hypothetical protein n=1 Tax=Paraburkholderia sp. BR13439 TaxID=3236996 RepID=UPI0034CF2781